MSGPLGGDFLTHTVYDWITTKLLMLFMWYNYIWR